MDNRELAEELLELYEKKDLIVKATAAIQSIRKSGIDGNSVIKVDNNVNPNNIDSIVKAVGTYEFTFLLDNFRKSLLEAAGNRLSKVNEQICNFNITKID